METGLSNRNTKTIRRAIAAAAGVSALLIASTAQAALQDRDLDGDTVVDAFYDTELDITWLRNFTAAGLKNWETAVTWADGFAFAGYDDWRLPTADAACGLAYNCTASEMGHLWYVELGNLAGVPMANTGNFINLYSGIYWTGTKYAPGPWDAWAFRTYVGDQMAAYKSSTFMVTVVRAGDVPAVPEPQSLVLLLAGLTTLALARRPRAR